MKFAGHTMGTPKLDIFGAIDLFQDIGYDGIEVRVKEDGQINPDAYTPELGRNIREKLAETGLEMCCLTPYYRDFYHEEKRASELAGMQRVIEIAAELNCPLVRSYGGITASGGAELDAVWEATVLGLRECADLAAERGVSIAIETHIGSLTFSAMDTVRMVEDVDRKNVGILFDFAWTDIRGEETTEEALQLVLPHLLHCHVKDWVIHDREALDKKSSLMGEGDVPWAELLPRLAASGYAGYVCDEYEKYWYDHLPEPTIGMRRNLATVKSLLAG